jgi:2-succinyl-6-hydroxy-2,4-cyclohexadiene-1-carboxylate synthase
VARFALVHGFTQTPRSWDVIAEMLRAEGHHVVTPAVPGHDGVPAMPMPDAAAAVADAAGGRATYIGYSMGGRLTLQIAVDHPPAVDGLVLVGATAGIEDEGERAARRAADYARAARIEEIGVAAFVDEWLAQPLFARLPDAAAQREERLRNTVEGLAGALRLAGTGVQEPLWSSLGTLRGRGLPVLAIAGSEDAKFVALAERLANAIGRSAQYTTISDAGHAAHLERPDEFVALVRAWLEQRARSR